MYVMVGRREIISFETFLIMYSALFGGTKILRFKIQNE